ncbi:MAG: hypothetical protein WBG32_10235, partial [Nodosilinea sp.]
FSTGPNSKRQKQTKQPEDVDPTLLLAARVLGCVGLLALLLIIFAPLVTEARTSEHDHRRALIGLADRAQ